MDDFDRTKQTGKFAIGAGREIYGELTLPGAATSLYLHDKEFFHTHGMPGKCVRGVLHAIAKSAWAEAQALRKATPLLQEPSCSAEVST
jgi:hypothetical protein